jgi:hypothetical protein
VPIHIVNLEDSNDNLSHVEGGPTAVPDYPLNVGGSLTLTGHQFRMNSSANVVVAPAAGAFNGSAAAQQHYRIYVIWDDNAAGIIPGSTTTTGTLPITNTNIYYAYSDDQGATWVGGDQALTSASPETPGSGPLCVTGARDAADGAGCRSGEQSGRHAVRHLPGRVLSVDRGQPADGRGGGRLHGWQPGRAA